MTTHRAIGNVAHCFAHHALRWIWYLTIFNHGMGDARAYDDMSGAFLTLAQIGHMPEIDIISPTEARGVWAMEALVEAGNSSFHGFGHYWETYRKEDGQWRIARLLITRLRFEQLSRLSKRPIGKG